MQYDFEYTAKDGRLVSIKPNESYILVCKTNEHWWHVRKDQHTRPFYVPAQYVKELPSLTEGSPGPDPADSPERVTNRKPADNVTPAAAAVMRESAQGGSRETYRFSTFGFCEDMSDVKPCEALKEGLTPSSSAHKLDKTNTHSATEGFSFNSAPLQTDDEQLYSKPHPVSKVRTRPQLSDSSQQDDLVEQPQTLLHNEDMDFPPPPDLPVYDTIPELNIPGYDTFSELPDPVASNDSLMSEQRRLNPTPEATFSPDPAEQVRSSCSLTSFIAFIHHSAPVSLEPEVKMCHCDIRPGEGAVLP